MKKSLTRVNDRHLVEAVAKEDKEPVKCRQEINHFRKFELYIPGPFQGVPKIGWRRLHFTSVQLRLLCCGKTLISSSLMSQHEEIIDQIFFTIASLQYVQTKVRTYQNCITILALFNSALCILT